MGLNFGVEWLEENHVFATDAEVKSQISHITIVLPVVY